MKPSVAVDIIDRDKTGPGFRSAERRAKDFSRRSSAAVKESGFVKLGRQVEGLTRFRTLSFGFDTAGRSITSIGHMSAGAAEQVGGLTRNLVTMGRAGEVATGAVATGAVAAAGAVAGLTAAVIGGTVAAYMFGEKWAKSGARVGDTAKTIGMSAQDFQRAQGAAARFGVTGDQVEASYMGLSETLHDAQYGANNLALGAMTQLGIKLKKGKDGVVDYADAMDQVADAIARQKDPAVQRKLAAVFGVSGMLPALRRGSGVLKAEGADFDKTGSGFTDAEISKSDEVRRKAEQARQYLAKLEKVAGVKSQAVTEYGADRVVDAAQGFGRGGKKGGGGFADLPRAAGELAGSGAKAARELIAGAQAAGRELRGGRVLGMGREASARANQAAAFFQSKGWTPEQAAGIVANLAKESGFNEKIPGDGGKAYGIGQWHPDRQAEFRKWSGRDMQGSSFEDQLAFVQYELTQGREKKAGDKLRGARTAREAGAIVSESYERPRDQAGEMQVRGQMAQRVMVEVSFRNAPAGTVVTSSAAPGVEVTAKVARSLPEVGR